MERNTLAPNAASFNRLVRKLVRAEIAVANRPGDSEAVRARTKARKAIATGAAC